jgi:hypothetical protein
MMSRWVAEVQPFSLVQLLSRAIAARPRCHSVACGTVSRMRFGLAIDYAGEKLRAFHNNLYHLFALRESVILGLWARKRNVVGDEYGRPRTGASITR